MQHGDQGANWPKAVIFDLDGTLIDSAPDIAAALNEVLGHRGLPPIELPAVKRMVGGGIRMLINRALEAHGVHADDVDTLVEDMVRVYGKRATELTRLFDGAGKVIEAFHADGIKMAVCTNKVQYVTDIILRDLNIAHYFTAVRGYGPDIARKPDPAMIHFALNAMGVSQADAVMVGDSSADAGAARAAGIPVVLAGYGYAPWMIAELAPDAVIAHFSDLPAVLRTLRR